MNPYDPLPNLTAHEFGLSQLIAQCWTGDFRHYFSMPTPKGSAAHWHQWRDQRGHPPVWECSNLADAAEQYSWDYITAKQNKGTSEECRRRISAAINVHDQRDAEMACRAIFKWGGVGISDDDPSRIWVRSSLESNELIEKIQLAVSALKGPSERADLFDGDVLLMNSAMTKVFAFADPDRHLAIYDGRVGAALALLVIRYCRESELGQIPTELKFRWLDGRTKRNGRNPNEGPFIFSRLGNGQSHASNMWRASRILNAAGKSANCSITKLEQALFMIGYDVSEKNLPTEPQAHVR